MKKKTKKKVVKEGMSFETLFILGICMMGAGSALITIVSLSVGIALVSLGIGYVAVASLYKMKERR